MTSSETTFNDAELLIWLRKPYGDAVMERAADRIEALIEESGRRLALARSEGVARVEQFERTEALTEQLAAARDDAKEAEAYAEELETELNTCRMAQAVMDNTVAGLEAKLAECEARLGKAVEALQSVMVACDQGRMIPQSGAGGMTIEANIKGSIYVGVSAWPIEEARTTLAELTGGKNE